MSLRMAALAAVALAPALAVANPGGSRSSGPAGGAPAAHRPGDAIPELMGAIHAPNPHDAGGKPLCGRCHAPGQKHVSGDPVALCAQCHEPSFMKHPVGVELKAVPKGLPLGDRARIVCHTCHDPHDVKKHRAGLRLEYAELCLRCHSRHEQKSQRPAVK